LEYSPCLRFRGICGDGEGGRRFRELERCSSEEELFCRGESGVHVRSPGKGFGSTTESIIEGALYTTNTTNIGKETAVEVEESEETLELLTELGVGKSSMAVMGERCRQRKWSGQGR
jgi:hypothetical protein